MDDSEQRVDWLVLPNAGCQNLHREVGLVIIDISDLHSDRNQGKVGWTPLTIKGQDHQCMQSLSLPVYWTGKPDSSRCLVDLEESALIPRGDPVAHQAIVPRIRVLRQHTQHLGADRCCLTDQDGVLRPWEYRGVIVDIQDGDEHGHRAALLWQTPIRGSQCQIVEGDGLKIQRVSQDDRTNALKVPIPEAQSTLHLEGIACVPAQNGVVKSRVLLGKVCISGLQNQDGAA
ncbi:hypothetical protein FKM82_017323 [Ascaphus truei]